MTKSDSFVDAISTKEFLTDRDVPESIKLAIVENRFQEHAEQKATATSRPEKKTFWTKLPVPIVAAIAGAIGSAFAIGGDYILSRQEADLSAVSQRSEFQLRMIERYLDSDDEFERAESLWFLHDIQILTLSDEALKRWSKDVITRLNKERALEGQEPRQVGPPRLSSEAQTRDPIASISSVVISAADFDAIGRIVQTEVGYFETRDATEFAAAVAAVTDVILNRAAHPNYPSSPASVVVQRFQFAALNGNSLGDLPEMSGATREALTRHLLLRLGGAPSTIGPAVVFLNPALSSEASMAQWGDYVVRNASLVIGRGEPNALHFGLPPGTQAPPAYAVRYNGLEPLALGALLREILVSRARAELAFFENGAGLEHLSPYAERVGLYWSILGQQLTGRDQNMSWSAAFLSYLMHASGLGLSFQASSSNGHIFQHYVQPESGHAFEAISADNYAPQPGDILHYGRANDQGLDFQGAREQYEAERFYSSHSAIVVSVDSTSSTLQAIGGNVRDSVRLTDVPIDDQGFLLPRRVGSKTLPWIGILRVKESTPD